MNSKLALRLLALAAAGTLVASFLGCTPDEQTSTPTPPAVVAPAPTHVTVEPMPESSNELSRRHIFDANGVEIETQITYRETRHVETIHFRPNGKKLSSHRETPQGVVIADLKYAEDGNGIVSGFQKRSDGTMQFEVSLGADGTSTRTSYWWDGKSVFMVLTIRQDGSYTSEMHHKNGTLWMKRSGPQLGQVAREERFGEGGRLDAVVEPTGGNGFVVTNFRADGTVSTKQRVTIDSTGYYVRQSLQSVEEFSADGKTMTRRITVDSGGYGYGYYYGQVPSAVEQHNADGTVTAYRLRRDGSVSHEEVRDSTGKVQSQHDFAANDSAAPKVEVNRSLLNLPSTDNPESIWSNAEQSEYYRNGSP